MLVDSVGITSAWIPDLVLAALPRLDAAERAVLERIDVAALETPDPRIHSAYARAIYPAWFADRDLAALFSTAAEHHCDRRRSGGQNSPRRV